MDCLHLPAYRFTVFIAGIGSPKPLLEWCAECGAARGNEGNWTLPGFLEWMERQAPETLETWRAAYHREKAALQSPVNPQERKPEEGSQG